MEPQWQLGWRDWTRARVDEWIAWLSGIRRRTTGQVGDGKLRSVEVLTGRGRRLSPSRTDVQGCRYRYCSTHPVDTVTTTAIREGPYNRVDTAV